MSTPGRPTYALGDTRVMGLREHTLVRYDAGDVESKRRFDSGVQHTATLLAMDHRPPDGAKLRIV